MVDYDKSYTLYNSILILMNNLTKKYLKADCFNNFVKKYFFDKSIYSNHINNHLPLIYLFNLYHNI